MSYDWNLSPKNKPKKALSGAFGAWEDGNEYVQEICDKLKSQIEMKVGKRLDGEFEVSKFRKQCVLGTNYMIKLDVGDGILLDLRVLERIVGEKQALTLYSAKWPSS